MAKPEYYVDKVVACAGEIQHRFERITDEKILAQGIEFGQTADRYRREGHTDEAFRLKLYSDACKYLATGQYDFET